MKMKMLIAGSILALAACGGSGTKDADTATPAKPTATLVDTALIAAANDDTSTWMNYGRTYSEQRYSPADQINKDSVADLELAWFADMDTHRGQEATPLVIDGKIYTTTSWSMVKAYDAVTGELLWEYDPEVPGATAVKACCDVVNRGLAAWGDKLYVGALDGRLIALDRETGKEVWSSVTVDQSQPYTITGAPVAINGKIIIGNGGAEMGVRGYVGAYDAETGEQVWRFYTVPDNPANGEQPEYLEKALETWNGEFWKLGGGGTVWNAMAYDPELDLLYVGVGNGSPWNQAIRSPGGGDNLYLSSIVAVRPDTGEYVWHYQTTPGETWDYTATQHIMLADMEIEGANRKVLMQAPKNGFFYVIDRETGELISAKNYTHVNWASGIDENGRPIQNPETRYDKTGQFALVIPGPTGGHNWQPMAYDPDQNLVYIPVKNAAFPYIPEANWEPEAQGFNVGVDMAAAAMPADPAARDGAKIGTTGELVAWDPVTQSAKWRLEFPGAWNGGILATGGDLLFHGNAAGQFAAYDSADGEKVWSFDAQTGIVAAPMTYTVDGEQYVAVMAGWGGVWPLATGVLADLATTDRPISNVSRLLVFKIGGEAKLPELPPLHQMPLDPPALRADEATVALGATKYARFCGVCHGDAAVGGSLLPDLRRSAALDNADSWNVIVKDGALEDSGMVGWSNVMSDEEISAIRHYVIKRANEDKALEEAN